MGYPPPQSLALYAKALNCFKKQNCGKESNFSVKSKGLRRG